MEDGEGAMFPLYVGEDKDAEVKNGDLTTSGVYTTCVRTLDTG